MRKRIVKQTCLILIAILCLLLLSGCSFSDLMSKGTGIQNDPDYQTWEKLSEKGKLDSEGKYTSDAVHVTFAENSFLEAHYYKDAEKKEEIAEGSCYLLPGDFIYSTVKTRNESEGLYTYDCLNIVEYTEQNTRGNIIDWSYGEDGSTIIVPYDYKGTEVSIEPKGHYNLFSVQLEQPSNGGQIIYSVNGEALVDSTASLYSGARIKCQIVTDTGWESQVGDETTYTVSELDNQVVTLDGRRANAVFIEQEDHKPLLKVDINSNLGDCRVSVETSDINDRKDIDKKGVVIENRKTGTGEGVHLTFRNFAPTEKRNTIRITVTKKSSNDEYKEIHYADERTNTVHIDFNKDIQYSTVTIMIDAVKGRSFKPITDPDADIEAKFSDIRSDNTFINGALAKDQTVTSDRRIDVTIKPHSDCIIEGGFTANGIYTRNMSCDEYERFVSDALKNQLKKKCRITLDSSDPYGTVTYKLDGRERTGTIEVLEGKEIEIIYKIRDDEKYEIASDRGGLAPVSDFVGLTNKKEMSTHIKILREFDGKTIKREDYIEIKEVEK